jgi:hypothetical protein
MDVFDSRTSDLFFAFHHLATFVVSAFGTGLMGKLGLQALRAKARGNRMQEVVSPALSPACF